MRTLKGLVIGVALLYVFWAMPAHATVDWNDGFEYANDAALGAVWSYSCLGNPGVSALRPFSGSKSLRLVYNGHVGIDPGAGGCFIDRALNAVSDTFYFRIQAYLENFIPDHVSTKMIQVGQNGSYPNFWWSMLFSSYAFDIGFVSPDPPSFNLFGSLIPQNQWVCLEGRITMNTPGVYNGIIQTWVNGSLVINRTDLMLRNAVLSQQTGPNSQLRFVKFYQPHDRGVLAS